MSISDGLMARSSSGYSPVTVCRKMLSGRRMPSSSANFSAGMILPRGTPAMSGMIASTSAIPCSLKNCWMTLIRDASGAQSLIRSPLRPLTGSPAELCEQRARKRVVCELPLGVPLHRQRERRRIAHAEGFDQAVRRLRLDLQVTPQRLHALRVQRVDVQSIAAGQAMQQAAANQLDF